MPTRWIPYVKVLVHAVCLLPFLKLIVLYRSGALGLMADPVLYITLLTGYWTLYLLIASLAVTPVRRLHLKLGNLIRFRRLLGLYAFFYASVHLAVYLKLYANLDWPTIVGDLTKRPFIIAGFSAWLLLLPLALTSTKWSIRKLGKRWQTLHRLVYVAACLAVAHYWWIVKKGVLEPLPMTMLLTVLMLARPAWSWMESRRRQRVTAGA